MERICTSRSRLGPSLVICRSRMWMESEDTLTNMNAVTVSVLSVCVCVLQCTWLVFVAADRMSSFGDFIALSDTCDVATTRVISREVHRIIKVL